MGDRRDVHYAGPTGREKPGEHWNARIIREERGSAAAERAASESVPRPVIDREALVGLLRATRMTINDDWYPTQTSAERISDAVLELARPMPTREEIAQALHDNDHKHSWREHGVCVRYACEFVYPPMADAVLALFNGTEQ